MSYSDYPTAKENMKIGKWKHLKFFRDDGFVKKKNLGRVEYLNDDGEGIWKNIKAEWLNLYYNRIEKTGMSVIKEVSHDDVWGN